MNELTVPERATTGTWRDLLPGKTIYAYDNQLWIGTPYAQGYDRRIKLTPLTEEEHEYLRKRGVLQAYKRNK